MSAPLHGTVQSHTVIRVPDRAHAAMAPFVLLLVKLQGGKCVLGHFTGLDVPAIGACVTVASTGQETPIFTIEETS